MIKMKKITHFLIPMAFDNTAGWKIHDDGNVILQNGNPVWVDEDGNESTVQANTISKLNKEAKTHRLAKEAAEKELEKFKDIDPDAARTALETVKDIDLTKMVDKGELDKVKQTITAEYSAKIAEKDEEINKVKTGYNDLLLDNAFNSSEFVQNNISVPVEMFRATFANKFSVENGKIVTKGADGQPLRSKKKMGEDADFDEALELIVNDYKHKDSILKADGHQGSGNGGGGAGGSRGRKITRDEFNKLSPGEQAKTAAEAGKGEIAIVD